MNNAALLNLLSELSNYHNDKDNILYKAVEKRLEKSLNVYIDDLDDSYNYLKCRNTIKLMRKLSK